MLFSSRRGAFLQIGSGNKLRSMGFRQTGQGIGAAARVCASCSNSASSTSNRLCSSASRACARRSSAINRFSSALAERACSTSLSSGISSSSSFTSIASCSASTTKLSARSPPSRRNLTISGSFAHVAAYFRASEARRAASASRFTDSSTSRRNPSLALIMLAAASNALASASSAFSAAQCPMQLAWKIWSQGGCTTFSPGLQDSLQMLHSTCESLASSRASETASKTWQMHPSS
mmetsp:Transcript_87984/g.138921  ORF Transcript_87984/g.138921 Transcript_87984/m.138921 type:complete len:235 (-) Transcript_87984:369-1073(-)